MRKLAMFALSLLGLFDSAYLLWVYTSPSSPMVCLGGGTGCDEVRASAYAHLFGVPLPAFGVLMYVTLALLIFTENLMSARRARLIRWAVAGIAGAGFLFSLYLTSIEAFVLHAWCTWCMIQAISVTLIFALALWVMLRPEPLLEPAAVLVQAQRQLVVFAAAIVLGVPAFYYLVRTQTIPPVPTATEEALIERLVRPDSHATGNLQSRFTLVEFADFQCAPCGAAEPTLRKIRAQYGDRIRFVFRHFPIESIHPYAFKAAEASECAAEQGKFWEAAEKFYRHQADLRLPALKRYAAEMGLDTRRFNACLESKAMAARVSRDFEDARALGLRATPTLIIGRRVIEGAPAYKQLAQLLNQELAAVGVAPPRPPTTTASASVTVAPAISQPAASTPAKPALPASSSPAVSTAGGGLFGSRGGGFFAQAQAGAATCSEEEAKTQQPPLIHTAEAQKLLGAGGTAQFVDVRSASEFSAGHIPHAINVPANEIASHSAALPKDKIIVFYEGGHNPGDPCGLSRNAARYLLAHGYTREQVKVYQDGLAGWEKEGLPVER